MKKSLLAVAAMGAFASAAQAQSSVTVYGILDVGFAGSTTRSSAASVNGQQRKSNQTGFTGVGSETTSRLGFRGVEDLGGGTSAFFTVEVALTPTDASASGNYSDRGVTTSTNWFNNRQSFVGLEQKGLGRVAIGTQYTPIHLAVGATDPGQQNNMKGNVIYNTNNTQGAGETTASYTVRFNQALTLASDNFAGFRGYAMFGQNNVNSTQLAPSYTNTTAGGNVNSSAWGLGVNYTYQKFYATVAYQATQSVNDSVSITANAAGVVSSSNAVTGNVNSSQTYAAATYDFGILKAYAQWIGKKDTSQINSGYYAKRTALQLGVRSFITPTIEAWGSLGQGRVQTFGIGEPTANFTGWQLGSNYLLSKRTNLYAIYGNTQTSSGTNGNSAGGNSYGVGVRHTF
jgi:predicted porin